MSRLVTQAEFARIAGVNRSTVTRWLQNGRIQADPSGLIDPEAAHKMRDATESPLPHHQARKAQFDEARAGDGPSQATNAQHSATSPIEPDEAYEKPADRYMRLKADKVAMEIDERARLLVERAEVDFIIADFGNTLRGLLEGLPDRLSGALAAHRGDVNAIHKSLEDTAHDLLTEISEHMKRKMETA